MCHSYSEIVSLSPCFGSPHRSSEKTLLVSKPNLPFGYVVRNSDFQVCNHDVRKSVICSNLVPQRLNGFYLGNKQLEEPSSKLNFVKTLLIDNYDSYTYNIYQELSVINGIPPVVVRNDEWTWEDACYYLYEKKAFHNIVISPGPGSPTCANDIGICLQLLLKCKDIPILGVCLGHQALGYVHGARVVHAPEPVHGRLSEIEHTGCRLFQDIPSGKNSGFKVVRYHSLVVDSESLPRDLLPIAWTLDTDTQKSDCIPVDFGSKIIPQNDEDMFSTKSENGIPQRKWTSFHSSGMESRVLMGIMHSTRPHYGLQFHPESIATCHGRQIFNNFREMTVDYWLRSSSSSMRKQKAHHAGGLSSK